MCCGDDDAVDEDKLVLCCAFCCANCAFLPPPTCCGCSGKAGLCCLNCEYCLKPGAPCLPCCCCGPAVECDGCSLFNAQGQCCCAVVSMAFPCNEEVPIALTVLGLTMYPECGCCKTIEEIKMERFGFEAVVVAVRYSEDQNISVLNSQNRYPLYRYTPGLN
eukprot:6130554-Ditylum_brightwellii.AAC.1